MRQGIIDELIVMPIKNYIVENI